MRRAVVSTKWVAAQWESKATTRQGVSSELKDGLSAYAHEQADGEAVLAEHWSLQWAAVRRLAERCLDQNGGLDIQMGEGSAYFSNEEEDIDVDDVGDGRRPEPVTIEITIEQDDDRD